MNESLPEPAIAIVRGSIKEQDSIVRDYADAKHFDIRCVFEDFSTSVVKGATTR